MINSRLYYNIKELPGGILKFYYFTYEINKNVSILKTSTKLINQQDVLYTLNKIGIKNLLYNINEVEFSRLLIEVEKHKDKISQLSLISPPTANIATKNFWGPIELQGKFMDWFGKNRFSIPDGN